MKRLAPWISLVVFALGLVLFGVGLGLAWLPLGLVGPGVVLMYISVAGERAAGGTKERKG